MVQFHFPQLFDNQQLTTRAGAARHNSFTFNDLYDFPVLGYFLKQEKRFFEEALQLDWEPLRIGVCTGVQGCTLRVSNGGYIPIDPLKIANTYVESGGDPQTFLAQLLKLETSWQIQKQNG